MDGDFEKREVAVEHFKNVIKASAKLGVGMVTTFIGADQWPGGQNLMTTPAIWRKVYEIFDSHNL
jgi:sugar phosphate isomerase/epimerase